MKKHLYPIVIIGFVLFSLAPTFYELTRANDLHANREFELVHNFPTDYNFYLSRIREGLEGRWTVVEKYTSEPHNGSFIHQMYLLMGVVGRFAHVPLHRAADIYHVARIVLAVALLAAIAEYCRGYWGDTGDRGNWGIFAFLLAITASSWPKLVEVEGVLRFGGYMAWWSVMDSLQRITFIPHLLAGQTLIIFLIREIGEIRVIREGKNILFLGILAFVLGMIFPPGLLFVIGVIGVLWVLRGRNTKEIFLYGAVFLMGSAALLYLALMTGIYPWKRLAEVDIIRPLPFDFIEYFKAVGVIGVLGGIGGIWALWKKEKVMYPAVAWVIAWIVFLVIFTFVPQQSPLRFSEMIPHVPLGILSAYTLYKIREIRGIRGIGEIAAIALIAMGLFHMYSSFLWQKDFVDHKIRATLPLVPTGSFVMYPLKEFVAAMQYLWDATEGKGIILSETTAGNYIPARIGNTVYLGHDNTVAFEEKKKVVVQFFSGKLNRDWLKSTGASYIFFGPQEKEYTKDLKNAYPFLVEVYKNSSVTIYKVP